MNRERIELEVRRLVAQVIASDETEVGLNSLLMKDLGCDSLDEVQIVMALEDFFEIEINDEEAELRTRKKLSNFDTETVGWFCDLVQAKLTKL